MKRILYIIFCVILLFSSINLSVYAETGDFVTSEYGYEYTGSGELPQALSYYYVHQGYVHSVPINNAITTIINQRLGTSFSPNWFLNFESWLVGGSNIALSPLFIALGQSNLVMNNGTICGVAAVDISGKTYGQNVGSNESVNITNQLSNAVYLCLNDYLETEAPVVPDYISVGLQTKSYALSHVYDSGGDTSELYGLINSTNGYFTSNINGNQQIDTNRNAAVTSSAYSVNFYSADSTDYNVFCNAFNLTTSNHTVTFNSLLNSATSAPLYVGLKNKSDYTDVYFYNSITPGSPIENIYIFGYSDSFRNMLFSPNGGYTTIYKNASIIWEMKNKTYTGQPVNFGTNYYDYSTNNNNSFDTTNTTINNSPTTNTTIYNEQNSTNNNYYQSIVENVDNTTYIDNSVINNNNTTIIYNYYADPSPSPSPSPDPGGDDDDNPIWQALLQAIANFFTRIGEVIAALLTGIIGLFSSVLDLISNIQVDISGLTNFLSSIIGFLPTELVSILVAGVSLMVIICIIKALK